MTTADRLVPPYSVGGGPCFHDTRDQIVDDVNRWAGRTELPAK